MIDNTNAEIQKLKEENLLIKDTLKRAIDQIDSLMDHTITLAKTVNDHDKELAGIAAVNKELTDMDDPILKKIIEEDYNKLWGEEDSPEVDHVRYEEMEDNKAKVIKLTGEDDNE